jgi:hypothetical protein
MNFNKHLDLEGQHAFLGASKYHWLGYDEDKVTLAYRNFLATQRGTELHDFARRCIELGICLPRTKETLNMYVNDAIGYKMTPEQPFVYSRNCFGTADAASFRRKLLRVHDYKSGVNPAKMQQLEIYAALFCLEYSIKPEDIGIELRLYQNQEILFHEPEKPVILGIMDKIVLFDQRIEKIRSEG